MSNWSRQVFEDMRQGSLTAANCTCSVWEGFHDTMINIGQWNRWLQEHGDLIVKARTVADIRTAKERGRTAVILGFQNTSAFEDRLEFIEIFKDRASESLRSPITLRTWSAAVAMSRRIRACRISVTKWSRK